MPSAESSLPRTPCNVVIVKPSEPFLYWLQSLPNQLKDLALEDLPGDSFCLLIPESDSQQEATALISKRYKKIFESELMAWHIVKRDWPKKRTLAIFREWFDLEFHSKVIDLVEMPIEKEDFYLR